MKSSLHKQEINHSSLTWCAGTETKEWLICTKVHIPKTAAEQGDSENSPPLSFHQSGGETEAQRGKRIHRESRSEPRPSLPTLGLRLFLPGLVCKHSSGERASRVSPTGHIQSWCPQAYRAQAAKRFWPPFLTSSESARGCYDDITPCLTLNILSSNF